jgi:hypothetical protein
VKELDILKDLLQNHIENQIHYNANVINVRNPEMRQIYVQLRDDETRAVIKLQQKIQRLENMPGIISKIFPVRKQY